MSPARQPRTLTVDDEPFLVARSYRGIFSSGAQGPEHAHPWRQLVYATTGAMTVRAGSSTWLVPPGKAVFVPSGVVHSILMWGRVEMQTVYLRDPALDAETCRVLTVTPLLRELILRVVEWTALDSRDPERL